MATAKYNSFCFYIKYLLSHEPAYLEPITGLSQRIVGGRFVLAFFSGQYHVENGLGLGWCVAAEP